MPDNIFCLPSQVILLSPRFPQQSSCLRAAACHLRYLAVFSANCFCDVSSHQPPRPTAVELKLNLDQYVNKRYPGLVKVVRNGKREGLIRARILGWRAATAPVVGFFDAHVEFNVGW